MCMSQRVANARQAVSTCCRARSVTTAYEKNESTRSVWQSGWLNWIAASSHDNHHKDIKSKYHIMTILRLWYTHTLLCFEFLLRGHKALAPHMSIRQHCLNSNDCHEVMMSITKYADCHVLVLWYTTAVLPHDCLLSVYRHEPLSVYSIVCRVCLSVVCVIDRQTADRRQTDTMDRQTIDRQRIDRQWTDRQTDIDRQTDDRQTVLPYRRMGWLRSVGSIEQVSFAKEPYQRDNILQKRLIILLTVALLTVAAPYTYGCNTDASLCDDGCNTDPSWCQGWMHLYTYVLTDVYTYEYIRHMYTCVCCQACMHISIHITGMYSYDTSIHMYAVRHA